MPGLTDTHCHIHEAAQPLHGDDATIKLWAKLKEATPESILADAQAAGVSRLICVGCTPEDSRRAVAFAATHDGVWASIGIHPHEASRYADDPAALKAFADLLEGRQRRSKIIAVGECGLDYFYENSPRRYQIAILRFQIELALKHGLPMIFHVRDAFDDFWRIFDEYKGVRGVVHSFTAGTKELEAILERGLYVGLNGIMTFTKQVKQLDAAKAVPLDRLVLETDAPFLTPQPLRGSINEPKYVRIVAEFLSELRGENLEALTEATTANAQKLFGIGRQI